MPNIDQLLPSRRSLSPSKKTVPRAVLGISNILFHRPDNSPVRSQPALTKPPVAARRSLSTRRRRNPRADTQNINTLSFLEFDSTIHVENTPPSPSISAMTATQERQPRPARRQVLRVDAQDGPWTVSVAENPHRPSSYTLYVKSKCPFTKELSELVFFVCRDAPSCWGVTFSFSSCVGWLSWKYRCSNFVLGAALSPTVLLGFDGKPRLTTSLPFPAPTHNLTLSRTARELVELDHKLHDVHPSVFRPALPIDPSALPQPTKRKSVILNTLSRLASPASKSTGARNNSSLTFTTSPVLSPVVSPKAEIADPFFDDLGAVAVGASNSANPTITGLAAYLTTLSNDQVFRQARPWKRFVRVRTDDLESVRVERAIRRVRSDVAAHISSPSTVNVTMHNSSVLKRDHESQDDNFTQDTGPSPSLDDSEGVPSPMLDDTASSTSASARSVIEIEASDNGSIAQPTPPSPPSPLAVNGTHVDQAVDPPPSTPVAAEYPSRIPRSQSADPDKAARLSRVYTPSDTSVRVSGTETTTSASASATEDDSPLNPLRDGRERKKRSKSRRAKDRVSRKVQVSDFEMMRVLGKGCAGKVLLVRHKSSSDLYALKAITKRHVLAHQELQHTLTEQAVLRRMAAEGTDPFVVKLWWSFHDKENLFLVMVRLAFKHTQ